MVNKKIRIGLDVDGVLRDFDSKALEVIERVYPGKVKSNITTSWDYVDNVDVDFKELQKLWKETHAEEIFREANLMPRVKEELRALKDWMKTGKIRYQIVIVTSQMPYNINHTFYWLGKHNFNFTEVFVSNHKHTLDIDYLIDDSPKNYEKWIAAGRDETKYILFDRPYNQNIPATNRIKTLSESIQILEKMKF